MCDSCAAAVSLLIALPMTQAGFETRVTESDWLSKFNDRDLDDAERAAQFADRWRLDYSPNIAEPLQQLVTMAAGRGIAVTMEATLDALGNATASASIVILFAHWKGPEVLLDDFAVDRAEFERRAAGDSGLLGRWLHHRFAPPERGGSAWNWFRRRPKPLSLRGVLEEFVERPDDDLPSDGVDVVLEADFTRMARRRDELDAFFTGAIRPGNRLELYDGLHAKEEVERIIAADFAGVLDLTTCTSTYLADHIASCRKHCLHTVQFPAVQDLLWAAHCITLTLELFLDQHIPYLQARACATAIMERVIGEYAVEARS